MHRRSRRRSGAHGLVAATIVASVLAVAVVVALVALALGDAPADTAEGAVPGAAAPVVDPDRIDAVPVPASRSVAALPDPEWIAEIAGRTGIPIRPLSAYAGVTLRLADERPGCHLQWTTLAAIGRVETVHATIFDSVLDDDGRATPPIIGIALDGDGVLAIADTDGGALDGDAEWDRAIGPMQFIPSTWAIVGADGNADGVADAQQIDDAVLTAGLYLCAHERDLADSRDWLAAVRAYNPNPEYIEKVADVADRYAAAANG